MSDVAKNAIYYFANQLARKMVIMGYDEFCSGKTQQRALLSYLVMPLLPPSAFRDHIKFSNRGIAQEIPRVLNELGYKVDIINFNNTSWLPKRCYEIFIGHGGINFERLSSHLPEPTRRICFSTGIYWMEFNFRLAKRFYDIALRRGYLLQPKRFVAYSEEYANEKADGIICLGNQEALKSYGKFRKVIAISNAVYPVNRESNRNKDYDAGRKHFLFFSGRGNVLKGLDLVLEAFVQSELHLHICQHMEPDFLKLYCNELTRRSNIHVHGFVRMRSPCFQKLAKQCNWVISASCAEGQPGAILECMGYGLIPILSDSNNIDLGIGASGWRTAMSIAFVVV